VRATASGGRPLAAALALAVGALAATARAGGLEVGDNAAEAMGRGGAFVAKADNPATVNYNPAGFAKLGGHHVTISLSAVNSTVDFQRAPEAPGAGYPLVQNSKPWFVTPMHLVLTSDFGISRRLTFAAGIYGPPAATRVYGRTVNIGGTEVGAPQRYDLTSTGGLILFPTLAAGYRIADWIDVGVSFQWAVTKISTTSIATVAAACPDTPEDPACDVTMKIDAQNLFAPTGSAGVLLRPRGDLEFGAMLRFPSSSDLHGRAKVEFGSGVQRLGDAMSKKLLDPETPPVTISNGYPLMFRVGGRYVWFRGGQERADLELDLTYENWSSVSRRNVKVEAESLGRPMAPLEIDWKLRDTVGARLGGSYRVPLAETGSLVFRGGLFYESASTAVSDTSLQVLGPRRLGLSVGVGLAWKRVVLDVAYAHIFIPQRTVENSTLTAMDFGGSEPGPVVGNGTYRSRVDGLYVQLTALYGSVRRLPRHEEEPAPVAPAERETEAEETLRRRPGEEAEEARGPTAPGGSVRRAAALALADEGATRLADPDDAEQVGAERERPRLKRARMERPAKVGKLSATRGHKVKRARPVAKERSRCLQRDSQGRCLLERRAG
jgi:long-chain fatty acid transport protein